MVRGAVRRTRGYLTSLIVGFGGLAVCMALAWAFDTKVAQVLLLVPYTLVLLLMWPALEALVTEHEPPARMPHMVGVYNLTWSFSTAWPISRGGRLYDVDRPRRDLRRARCAMFFAAVSGGRVAAPAAAAAVMPEAVPGRRGGRSSIRTRAR